MGDLSLFIVAIGAILVNVCSSTAQNFDGSNSDEPVRMASDSLVVKSYKEVDTSTMASSTPDDPDFQIYQGVMGRPGIDFPVYPNIPATDFNCREIKRSGYYADLATDCQVFHICDGGRKISFLCPNGTIFRQSHLICDWWFRVDCGKSVELYEESAEQLAADQKIYKARAEERERRRKLVKSAFGESDDELVGSEVYALDEPFDIRGRKYPQAGNKAPSTTPIPPSTPSSTITSIRHPDEGKRERNSKKVVDSKFPRQGKSEKSFEEVPEKKIIEKISYVHPKARNQEQSTTQRTIHPVIVQKSRFPGRNSIPAANKESFQEAASGGLVNNQQQVYQINNNRYNEPKQTEPPESIGLTTEYPDFEIKKTTTEIKYETTTYDSRRTPTPRYRPQDQERQHLAETASFTSNRGGKTYNDFQNEYNRAGTTTKKVTSPPTSTSPVYKPTVPVIKTTPRPLKQNSRKVTLSPSTYTPSINITRSTTQRIPIENIYFTTIVPEKVEKKSNGSDVDISLQELNIHKVLADPQMNNKSYEDAVREGLEVPPSSGPNALRSFALYFASNDNNSNKDQKIGPYLSKDILIIPITRDIEDKISKNTFESKKKDVVKQVEDIVDKSSSVSSQNRKIETLPNSLTQQTKESYSALFRNNTNVMSDRLDVTETDDGTTGFDSFTEQPLRINSELTRNKNNNDLDQSQSRGIVEPDPRVNQLNDEFSRVSPDLRELAQVFTKALSAYLDDPEAFRRVLSEIRPTEPSPRAEEISSNPIDYPSATQEDDEVLDFSDVTKVSYKKKSSTSAYRETTTEYIPTEAPTTNNEFDNLVLPLSANDNQNIRIPDIELQAPLFESLDQSQSRYYTPSPNVGTTNAIAEEINNEFSTSERLPEIDSNEAVDSYFPITGSVDDRSRPRYGGFQNNSRSNKYSPYGAELTSTYSPYGAELISTTPETTTLPEERITTFNPRSRTSPQYDRTKYEEVIKNQTDEEIDLAKELNNLAIPTKPEALPLHISNSINNNVNKYQNVKLGNGETIERNYPRGRTTEAPQQYETNPEEINLELSPPVNTEQPKGFLITYSLEDGYNKYLPKAPTTTEEAITTTLAPTTERLTTLTEAETLSPTTFNTYETSYNKFTRATRYPTTTEEIPSARPPKKFSKSAKSLQRITELQEELMFNTTHVSNQQRERARVMVEETMGKMNMTESTADTLMKMMEMAAKNETYRRLVLLLVNDKSGKNKTVEEARLSLLKALLTPVLTNTKSRKDPTTTTVTTTTTTTTPQPSSQEPKRRTVYRKSKSISSNSTRNAIRTTTLPPSTTVVQRRTTVKSSRRTKTTRAVQRIVKTTETPTTTIKSSTVLGNLGLIRKTIENSRSKEVRVNSLDDAILDSDSRAIELLRSLYSLAARWG